MIGKNMDAADSWHTSTPLQCRHDSGYGRYPKHYGLLELSPIRKQASDIQQAKSNANYLGSLDKINRRKLSFISLCNSGNVSGSSASDSGIELCNNASVSESDDHIREKSQYITDENSNFISLIGATECELYQPSKYICKDHSHQRGTSDKCKKNTGTSKVFKSYSISSDLFKPVNKSSKIDFLYELDIRNCTSIISNILSYLSDEDLRQANNTSKRWQDIVLSDKNANSRRIFYINNKKNAARGPNKENKVEIVTPITRDHKSAFTCLANKEKDKQPLTYDTIQGRFDSFIQEHKIEGNCQTLMKCPKCRYPARADMGFKYCCTRNLCKHEFCRKCLGPFLDNHKCSVFELNDTLSDSFVGSRKSRKNLRRLKAL